MAAVTLPQPTTAPRRHLRVVEPRRGGTSRGVAARSTATSPRPSAATYRRRRLVALAVAVVLLDVTVRLLAVAVPAVIGSGAALVSDAVSAPPATAPADGPGTLVGAPSASPAGAGSATVLVHRGETLWDVARRLQPRGDIRPLVDRIAELNGGAALEVGQRLVLPELDG